SHSQTTEPARPSYAQLEAIPYPSCDVLASGGRRIFSVPAVCSRASCCFRRRQKPAAYVPLHERECDPIRAGSLPVELGKWLRRSCGTPSLRDEVAQHLATVCD